MENRPLRTNHLKLEQQFVRKRERETRHAETWNSAVKYYDKFERSNTKFDEWTSPRYYDTNNQMISTIKKERDKQELLEKRRKHLQTLLAEDDRTYQIELMMQSTSKYTNNKKEEIPTELLSTINAGLKFDEEMKRRHNAEHNLYRAWRGNSSVLRDCQTRQNTKDIKMSWLDAQIEKRMAKEKEEEQTRKLLRERDLYIEEQKAKELELKRETDAKETELKEFLVVQMDELLRKEKIAAELRLTEAEELRKVDAVELLEAKLVEENRRRCARDVALSNMRQHRRKLEQKSKQIEEELECDRLFIQEIKNAELVERIENEEKKRELKRAMDEFTELIVKLKDIEKKRKPHILFTFESEAGGIYNSFNATWEREQEMRRDLMKGVMQQIKEQIDANVQRNKQLQIDNLKERECMLEVLEKDKREMEQLREDEKTKRDQFKKDLDVQIKENRMRKKKLESLEKKQNDDELDKLRDEEARLKKEISKIQSGKTCPTYGRRRFFY